MTRLDRWAVAIGMVVLSIWIVWTEIRVHGLEIRMNIQEASQHWQEEPPR